MKFFLLVLVFLGLSIACLLSPTAANSAEGDPTHPVELSKSQAANWSRGGIQCNTSSNKITADCEEWVELEPSPYPGWVYRHYYSFEYVRYIPGLGTNTSVDILPLASSNWNPIPAWQNGRNLLSAQLPPAVPSGILIAPINTGTSTVFEFFPFALLPYAAHYDHWPWPLHEKDPVEVWNADGINGPDAAFLKRSGHYNITSILADFEHLRQQLTTDNIPFYQGFWLFQYADPDLIKGFADAEEYEIVILIDMKLPANVTIPPPTKLSPWSSATHKRHQQSLSKNDYSTFKHAMN